MTGLTVFLQLLYCRRDLAVILLHGGEPGAARAELRAYMATSQFKTAADPFDKVSIGRLIRSFGAVWS